MLFSNGANLSRYIIKPIGPASDLFPQCFDCIERVVLVAEKFSQQHLLEMQLNPLQHCPFCVDMYVEHYYVGSRPHKLVSVTKQS